MPIATQWFRPYVKSQTDLTPLLQREGDSYNNALGQERSSAERAWMNDQRIREAEANRQMMLQRQLQTQAIQNRNWMANQKQRDYANTQSAQQFKERMDFNKTSLNSRRDESDRQLRLQALGEASRWGAFPGGVPDVIKNSPEALDLGVAGGLMVQAGTERWKAEEAERKDKKDKEAKTLEVFENRKKNYWNNIVTLRRQEYLKTLEGENNSLEPNQQLSKQELIAKAASTPMHQLPEADSEMIQTAVALSQIDNAAEYTFQGGGSSPQPPPPPVVPAATNAPAATSPAWRAGAEGPPPVSIPNPNGVRRLVGNTLFYPDGRSVELTQEVADEVRRRMASPTQR